MTRPLRIQFPGALYHVTARGDRKSSIYLDDTDRAFWMQTLAEVCAHFNFAIHSFCQMSNHYHILLETEAANLAQGMRDLNGIYSQYFNRRHGLVGHVFQGRYKAILVQKENYLLELARYIVLNPVRANVVTTPEEWPWSSYRLMSGTAAAPAWLNTEWILEKLSPHRPDALAAYKTFVHAGIGKSTPLAGIHDQLILGDDAFIAQFQAQATMDGLRGIARLHRAVLTPPLQAYLDRYPDRDEAMAKAHATSAYTITAIALHFNVSHKTAARAIKRWRGLPDS